MPGIRSSLRLHRHLLRPCFADARRSLLQTLLACGRVFHVFDRVSFAAMMQAQPGVLDIAPRNSLRLVPPLVTQPALHVRNGLSLVPLELL